MSIQTGHLNGLTPSGRILVDGSFDTVFAVPGPTSSALRCAAWPFLVWRSRAAGT
jgi:hypothetical protein